MGLFNVTLCAGADAGGTQYHLHVGDGKIFAICRSDWKTASYEDDARENNDGERGPLKSRFGRTFESVQRHQEERDGGAQPGQTDRMNFERNGRIRGTKKKVSFRVKWSQHHNAFIL